MKLAVLSLTALLLVVGPVACKSSHEEGVKSSYRSQWTMVNANTKATTDAAKDVLEDEGLKDIKSSATMVDGEASGKKADGTKINVAVKKEGDETSQVSVNVGALGDPKLGADLAKRIKDRAEGK